MDKTQFNGAKYVPSLMTLTFCITILSQTNINILDQITETLARRLFRSSTIYMYI